MNRSCRAAAMATTLLTVGVLSSVGNVNGDGGLAFVDLAESEGKARGHNLFFGLSDRPGNRLTSFAEFRWTFYDDTSPFRLALGFTYALTGRWR